MLFNSWHFILFILAVLCVASWLPRYKTPWKIFIVAASCYFYGQWSYFYLGLIFVTAAVDFTLAQRLSASLRPGRLLALSIVANLGVLAFFKYTNFLIQSANGVAQAAGFIGSITPLDIVLPVGISFYTFQNMSYTIDVYRGQLTPRKSMLDYAVFSTFFPQLLAGPIVRASEFFEQLDHPPRIDLQKIQYALILIAAGYVKKVVLADNLAISVDEVFSKPADASAWQALLAVYAFAFQIYFDFSGYTDIAIGLALLLGFQFPKNFNYPYLATSCQEFWRRWHMTLSRWLRDYLYIPLGGNKYGLSRTTAALMTTMVLGGLWHGASWNFVIWGTLHGFYLVLERLAVSRIRWWKSDARTILFARWFLTFHLICFAWIFFRSPDFTTSLQVIQKIGGIFITRFDGNNLSALAWLIATLGALHFFVARFDIKNKLSNAGIWPFSSFIAAMILLLIWFMPAKTVPFIYFQF
jgi:alginate O-acetyltransferase complex protein AlgI